jgi:predicted DCC family thiol-disulfide oxidoreductase YuxK
MDESHGWLDRGRRCLLNILMRSSERGGGQVPPRSKGGNPTEGPIIVFDAMCVLCSANAQFVLRHDRAGVFRLASMQSEIGATLYRTCGIDPRDPDTLIVVDGDVVLRDSEAVLAIYGRLGWPWKAALIFKLAPRRMRDPLYRWIARNRYRIFGRRESCWVPTPEHASRVL